MRAVVRFEHIAQGPVCDRLQPAVDRRRDRQSVGIAAQLADLALAPFISERRHIVGRQHDIGVNLL
jgi:hypothetical protein